MRSVLDVLLRPTQDLEGRLSRYLVIFLLRPQQGLIVVVVDRVDPALVDVVVALLQRLPEGPLDEVQWARAVREFNPLCRPRPASKSFADRRPRLT